MTIQQWRGWRDTSDKAITLTPVTVASHPWPLAAIHHVTKHRVISSEIEIRGTRNPSFTRTLPTERTGHSIAPSFSSDH